MLLLTSFHSASRLYCTPDTTIYSIANHQPPKCNYPELRFLAPIDRHGNDIRISREACVDSLGNFRESLIQFRQKLSDAYLSRMDEIWHWTKTLSPNKMAVLCSWPPFSSASKKHMKEFGEFTCHSSLVADTVAMFRPDIQILLDEDRLQCMVDLASLEPSGGKNSEKFRSNSLSQEVSTFHQRSDSLNPLSGGTHEERGSHNLSILHSAGWGCGCELPGKDSLAQI